MRLDHLLSKGRRGRSKGLCVNGCWFREVRESINRSGGDADRGDTRSHPEHDGKDLSGRGYCGARPWESRWLPDLFIKLINNIYIDGHETVT